MMKALTYSLWIVCLVSAPSFGADKTDNIGEMWHFDNGSRQEQEMNDAAAELQFEYAARLRDEIKDLKRELREMVG